MWPSLVLMRRSPDRPVLHNETRAAGKRFHQTQRGPAVAGPRARRCRVRNQPWTALTMSKIGMYIATTMPPTTTPSTTIMIGSMSDSRALTATSTSSS